MYYQNLTQELNTEMFLDGDANRKSVSLDTKVNLHSLSLDLESLKNFEVVTDQFKERGVIFSNAIALQPSNSFYPPRSGQMVLMGMPKSGWLEIYFEQGISSFTCYATSSERTIMTAYNRNHQVLAEARIEGANLGDLESEIPPNAELTVNAPNITYITLYSFDGQLTINDISFSF